MSLVLYNIREARIARFIDSMQEPGVDEACLELVATPPPACGEYQKLRCVDLPDYASMRLVRTWEVLEQSDEEKLQTFRVLNQQP